MPARNYSKTSLELRLKPKQYLVVVFVFIALAATVIFATTVERNRLEQNLRIQVERDALSLLSGLESIISQADSALYRAPNLKEGIVGVTDMIQNREDS